MIAFVGTLKTLTLTEEGAGVPTVPSLDHSRAHVHLGECALTVHVPGERGTANSKSDRRDLLKWTFFVFFFAELRDGGLLEMSSFSSMGSSMVPLANALLDHHISHFPCEVPCLFFGGLFVFPRSRIDFQNNLDEKHKKQTPYP